MFLYVEIYRIQVRVLIKLTETDKIKRFERHDFWSSLTGRKIFIKDNSFQHSDSSTKMNHLTKYQVMEWRNQKFFFKIGISFGLKECMSNPSMRL